MPPTISNWASPLLFDCLKPGGLYIIEDLGWQPGQIEASLPTVPKTAEVLSRFLATGQLSATAAMTAAEAERLAKDTSSLLLFDESQLNAMGDGYNRNHGLPAVRRSGWRARSSGRRVLSPYFWLFSARRFVQGLTGYQSVNWQSVKLTIIQRASD